MSKEAPFHLVLIDPNSGLIEQLRRHFAGIENIDIVQELGWDVAAARQTALDYGLELRELEEESGPSA